MAPSKREEAETEIRRRRRLAGTCLFFSVACGGLTATAVGITSLYDEDQARKAQEYTPEDKLIAARVCDKTYPSDPLSSEKCRTEILTKGFRVDRPVFMKATVAFALATVGSVAGLFYHTKKSIDVARVLRNGLETR